MLFRAMLVVGTIAALSPALDTADSPRPAKDHSFDHAALAQMARGTAEAVTKQVTQAVVTEAVKRMAAGEPAEIAGAQRKPIPSQDRDSLAQLVIDTIGTTASLREKPAPSRP